MQHVHVMSGRMLALIDAWICAWSIDRRKAIYWADLMRLHGDMRGVGYVWSGQLGTYTKPELLGHMSLTLSERNSLP